MSLRVGLGLGSAAAALAAVPAAARVAGQGGSFALGWLLLAGGSALVLGPVVALARASRPTPAALQGALAGAALAALPLAVFARLLQQNTHHRPLGAGTFAVVALLCVVLASFAAWRALVWLQQSTTRGPALVVSILGATSLAACALFVLATTAREWRGSIVDGALALVLVAVCVKLRVEESRWRRWSRGALALWVLLVVTGLALSRAALGPVVGQVAPVLSPLNGW